MFCSYNGIITVDNLDESGYVVIHQGAGLLKTLCISIFCVSLNKKKYIALGLVFKKGFAIFRNPKPHSFYSCHSRGVSFNILMKTPS